MKRAILRVSVFLLLATAIWRGRGAAGDPLLQAEWRGDSAFSASSVVVVNQRAYLASTSGAGVVFDLANRAFPRRMTGAEVAGDPYAATLTSGKVFELAWPYAVKAADQWSLDVIDLSAAGGPRRAGYLSGTIAHGVSISANRAFVANHEYWFDGMGEVCYTGGNFFIYDISNVASPVTLSGGGNGPRCNGGFSRDYYGAAAEGNIFATQNYGAVRLYDFSTGRVVVLSTFGVSGGVSAMRLIGGFLYCVGGGGPGVFTVVDARNPAAPRTVAERLIGPAPNGIWLEGGYAYISDSQMGLVVLDARNPEAPIVLGNPTTTLTAEGTAVVNGHVYVADRTTGLHAIRRDSAGHLSRVGMATAPSAPAMVRVNGTRGFVANASGEVGLGVFDLSAPENPRLVGSCRADGALGVEVAGDRVYVAKGYLGFDIVDVSNPAAPVRIGGHTRYSVAALPVGARHLYASGFALDHPDSNVTGLHVLDVSNPAAPAHVARLDILYPRSITLHGEFAYVAASTNGWAVLNVRDPAAPQIVVRHGSNLARIERVIRSGNHVYVLDKTNKRLDVFEVSEITQPLKVGSFGGLTDPRDFMIEGSCAYVADGTGGLKVLSLRTEPVRLEWLTEARGLRVVGPQGVTGRLMRSVDLLNWTRAQTMTLTVAPTEVAETLEGEGGYYVFVSP